MRDESTTTGMKQILTTSRNKYTRVWVEHDCVHVGGVTVPSVIYTHVFDDWFHEDTNIVYVCTCTCVCTQSSPVAYSF